MSVVPFLQIAEVGQASYVTFPVDKTATSDNRRNCLSNRNVTGLFERLICTKEKELVLLDWKSERSTKRVLQHLGRHVRFALLELRLLVEPVV